MAPPGGTHIADASITKICNILVLDSASSTALYEFADDMVAIVPAMQNVVALCDDILSELSGMDDPCSAKFLEVNVTVYSPRGKLFSASILTAIGAMLTLSACV